MRACVSVYECVCVCVCLCLRACVFVSVCMSVSVSASVYLCVCVCFLGANSCIFLAICRCKKSVCFCPFPCIHSLVLVSADGGYDIEAADVQLLLEVGLASSHDRREEQSTSATRRRGKM